MKSMFYSFAILLSVAGLRLNAADTLVFEPKSGSADAKHIVLIAGDEEYRTEESMPMLGKILSQSHGFKCTVLFSMSADGTYVDPNFSSGLRGLEALDTADLMIIGTRFRHPDEVGAAHITKFLNAGKPVIGIRTATHAFNGKGTFGGIGYGEFGRKILGEQWVNHHGAHKRQGARGVIENDKTNHSILNSVSDVFAPSDVYGVVHLTEEADEILMRGAVTETLDPQSKNIDGDKNNPMQPFAWLHKYTTPDGSRAGRSFCTTGGASVDFVNEDLRRMVINAAYFLTGQKVPSKANVDFIDPFHASFYGFIKEKDYWKNANMKPEDYDLGQSPHMPDPKGSPEWQFRDLPTQR